MVLVGFNLHSWTNYPESAEHKEAEPAYYSATTVAIDKEEGWKGEGAVNGQLGVIKATHFEDHCGD